MKPQLFSSCFKNIRICFCIFRISFVLLVVYKETAVLPTLKAKISICHQNLTCTLNPANYPNWLLKNNYYVISLDSNYTETHTCVIQFVNLLLSENLEKTLMTHTHKHFKTEQCVLLATLICIQLNLKDLFSSVVDFK